MTHHRGSCLDRGRTILREAARLGEFTKRDLAEAAGESLNGWLFGNVFSGAVKHTLFLKVERVMGPNGRPVKQYSFLSQEERGYTLTYNGNPLED